MIIDNYKLNWDEQIKKIKISLENILVVRFF
jgi:hypothetical protein